MSSPFLNRRQPTPSDSEGRASAFADHLREHAPDYFPENGTCSPDVRFEWKEVRRGSTLYGFHMAMGPNERRILIKVLSDEVDQEPPTGDPEKDRPRQIRSLELEPGQNCLREYEALSTLHDHIEELKDPRFAAVPVYGTLMPERAIVMELVARPTLRDLLGSPVPWRRARLNGEPDPALLFRNAGAWLKMYHGLTRPQPLTTRHVRRDEFVDFNREVTGFLARVVGRPSFFRRVGARVETVARSVLPEMLPAGLAHGDYALRNVLAGPEGAVTVIDTKAASRTAIYEDIGYFLTDLKCNTVQVMSAGKALGNRISLYEKAFIEGYFDGNAPLAAIRLYGIQTCLDKWAAIAARTRRAETLGERMLLGLRLRVTSHYFRKVIEAGLRDLGR
jgi:tRNA A-37 threonylcarbamoyl transferase component Bud32